MGSIAVYIVFTGLMVFYVCYTTPYYGRLELLAYTRHGYHRVRKETGRLLERLGKRYKRSRYETEIYEGIGFLRNTAAGEAGAHMTTDMVMEKLIEHGGHLSRVLINTLSLIRLNRKTEAVEFFESTVDTAMGRDFIRVILQWDEIKPELLSGSLLTHQRNMNEIRITYRKKQDELISDLIYCPVIVNIIIVFMNFIYVTYYLEQKAMLSRFFML